jgi:MFS transporter, AAHS family, 4-hydroxybenzoate transporter
METHGPIDVGNVVDQSKFRGLPAIAVVIGGLALVLDGFDIQAIAFAAPAMARDWGVSAASLGPVFSAALIGMALGGMTLGPLGDRIGRKPALLVCVLLFGGASLAGAWATNLTEMGVLRLLTGIGLGGAIPNVSALMSEYVKPRWRGLVVTSVVAGIPLGGLLGAAIAVWFVPSYGWQAMFVVGGVLPLALVPIMAVALPESARFLVGRPERKAELVGLLNRLAGEAKFDTGQQFVLADHDGGLATNTSLRTLFAPVYRRDTIAAWILFFCSIFTVYALLLWTPTLLADAGFSAAQAAGSGFYTNAGGIVGAVLAGYAYSTWGSKRALMFITLAGAVCAILLGQLPVLSGGNQAERELGLAVIAMLLVTGAMIVSFQCGMFAIVANIYATEHRATGLGWASAFGRFGGIGSSFLGTVVLGLGWHADAYFAIVAAVLFAAAATSLVLRRHLAGYGTNAAKQAQVTI